MPKDEMQKKYKLESPDLADCLIMGAMTLPEPDKEKEEQNKELLKRYKDAA